MEKLGLSVYQGRDWRKPNGKKLRPYRKKKRKYELGRFPTLTRLGLLKTKAIRTKGGNLKVRVYSADFVNLYDPNTGKVEKVKIIRVLENPSDRKLNRMKIITRGAIVETEKGKAIITSRPGQDGVLNAVLLS